MLANKLFNLQRALPTRPKHAQYPNFLFMFRNLETSNKQQSILPETDLTERKQPGIKRERKKKKPQKPPFVKNLFLGKFDREVLTFPEILKKDRSEMLDEMLNPIERYFKEEVDSKKIDLDAKIPPETLQGLKELGLYGMQVPEEFGGLELNATEFARIMEVIAKDGSIVVTLTAHQTIGFKGIILAGTEAQKAKYLPRLAAGEWTAAFCLTETGSGSDAASLQTTATLDEDGKGYRLNGTKIWISNGGFADVMTVFAKTFRPNIEKTEITAFIVERNFGGVTSGQPEDKMGIRGSNTTEVNFDNTYVPVENVLGGVGEGFKVAVNILNSGRFSMGSGSASVLRDLIESTVQHAVTRTQFGKTLADFAIIKEKIARVAVNTYAMESMSYLTAGLMDAFEDQDCAVEAAIVKVFATEKMWQHTSDCMQVLGGLGYMRDYPYERILRDCRIGLIFEGTNEILRLFIALSCFQHAGRELNEQVNLARNPLMNPKAAFSMVNKRFIANYRKPKLDLELYEFLHPSLREQSDHLEMSVKLVERAAMELLSKEGREISEPSKQYNVKRLADALIDTYAMTAVLARASRAYCIGLQNSDQDMLMATLFVHEASQRVEQLCKEVFYYNNGVDEYVRKIADGIFENGGYTPQHPLKRNWW